MEMTHDYVRSLVPARPETGHKGTFGHMYALAGSRGFTGAAKLVCEGALRSGAGLVTLSVPFPLGDALATSLLEAMTLRLPATEAETFAHAGLERALAFAEDKQAVVLGPGISRHAETAAFVLDFVPTCPVPLVVDADALNALSEQVDVLRERRSPCILTPHPGEMARLRGTTTAAVQADRETVAADFAREFGCVVVLKGHRTVVADAKGHLRVNPTGNVGLAKGGSGDVLTGLLGGLLAQGMDAYDAACLGVYLHGLAGDIAAESHTTRAMLARDVLNAFGEAWRRIEGEAVPAR
jgi:NAD(P)H-hydrate epimerase